MNNLEEREEVKKERQVLSVKIKKKDVSHFEYNDKIWFKQASIIWISERNGYKLVKFLGRKQVKFVSEKKKIQTFFSVK